VGLDLTKSKRVKEKKREKKGKKYEERDDNIIVSI